MRIEDLIGMPSDTAHAWMVSEGWIMYQPFSDNRIVYRSLSGQWVRYNLRLHEDNVERIDGIDSSGKSSPPDFKTNAKTMAEEAGMYFSGGSSPESVYERAAFLRGAKWMFKWMLNEDKTLNSNIP